MRQLELLAPAKNLECGIAAIDHGADAVYIGASRFGARAAAGNSVEDIGELCSYAHKFAAKVYVTVNTIIYDSELDDTFGLIRELQNVGVDALLVQDMGIVYEYTKRNLNIPLHASTQTDNRTSDKVEWLKSLGFRRVVLARESSLEEIKKIHEDVPDVELEVFVHGALCVSYSGLCYASQYCFNRSANRGECAQFCRLKFDLLDSDDNEIEHQRHLLSLKDLCQIENLESLADAGASSFKIEGRLKDVNYVKNVVAAYSEQLNNIVDKSNGKYCRASIGRATYVFEPNLKKTFNRGFTSYFLTGRQQNIASFDTPKAMGEYVGHVKEIRGNSFNVAGTASFANGDGLCFINAEHELEGFRVNRVEGNRLFPLKMPSSMKPGMGLYRNNDEAFGKLLSSKSSERKIPVRMSFATTDEGFRLTIEVVDNENIIVEQTLMAEKQTAQKPQHDNIVRQLTKLGNTIFACSDIKFIGDADQYFIPSSLLAELRRQAFEKIETRTLPVASESKFKSLESFDVKFDKEGWQSEYKQFPYTYNIANKSATSFYEESGLKKIVPAFEVSNNNNQPLLMQCRHCLRYSLGFCVKNGGEKPSWREPLFLRLSDGRRFRLVFNCNECQMNIYADKQ